MWAGIYNECNQPSYDDMRSFVNNGLWDELFTYIENKYKVNPKMEYSKCSAQKGWNVKFKKSGKSICTLYPMDGYFIALVVVGKKEKAEAEIALQSCTKYIQDLYNSTKSFNGARWLMIEVTDRSIFEDVIKLIQIRTA